jgi:hypothetical protein
MISNENLNYNVIDFNKSYNFHINIYLYLNSYEEIINFLRWTTPTTFEMAVGNAIVARWVSVPYRYFKRCF